MTLDRDKARERCEAATEGPWSIEGILDAEGETDGPMIWGPDGDSIVFTLLHGGERGFPFFDDADADFIAHARTDLPAALDEIERLRAALREIEQLNLCGSCDGAGYLGDPTDESGGCPKCGGTGYKQIGGGRIARDALAQIEEARLK